MHRVNDRLLRKLGEEGVRIDKIYFSPEHPDQPGRGRKPSPQFLLDARDEFGLDLAMSYMIGDKRLDLECGVNAGVRNSLLVRTGYGGEVALEARGLPPTAVVVDDLERAADWILSQD